MVLFPTACASCGAANRAHAAFCRHCGSPLARGSPPSGLTGRLTSGQVLWQRYRILQVVGRGGMGAVYKAEDSQFGNRLVAVKEMGQTGLAPQEVAEATKQFRQEALLLAGLKHPSLPSIYDHFYENGHWYLVMDFIEGETLAKHFTKAKGRVLPVPEVLEIGIQLSKVLGYLHTRPTPIIFRDLKPANVMLTPEGNVYLIDFGIARLFKPGQIKDTKAYGSEGYAAPEQHGRAQTTPQSDIYSLGAMLHEMLSGNDPSRTPFQFAPLRLGNQAGLASLERLIMQMVEMSKDKRPPSMDAVKQELQRTVGQQMARPALVTPPGTLPSSQKTKEQGLDRGSAVKAQSSPRPNTASPGYLPVPPQSRPPYTSLSQGYAPLSGFTSIPEQGTQKTYRGSGIAFLLAGACILLGTLIWVLDLLIFYALIYSITPTPTIGFTLLPTSGLGLLGAGIGGLVSMLILCALRGFHAKQADRAGWLGTIGVIMVAAVCIVAILMTGIIVMNFLPNQPPYTLPSYASEGVSLLYTIFYVNAFFGMVSYILVGISVIRSKVYPWWTGIGCIVGSCLSLISALVPSAIVVQFMASLLAAAVYIRWGLILMKRPQYDPMQNIKTQRPERAQISLPRR